MKNTRTQPNLQHQNPPFNVGDVLAVTCVYKGGAGLSPWKTTRVERDVRVLSMRYDGNYWFFEWEDIEDGERGTSNVHASAPQGTSGARVGFAVDYDVLSGGGAR